MNQTKAEKGINIVLILCEMKEANINKKAMMETKKGRYVERLKMGRGKKREKGEYGEMEMRGRKDQKGE